LATYHNNNAEIKAQERFCDETGIEIPLDITAGGMTVNLGAGIKAGVSNNYLTNEGLVFNKNEYYYKIYPADTQLQNPSANPARKLSDVISSLLNVNDIVPENFSIAEEKLNDNALISGENLPEENITIVSYVPEEPTEETLELYDTGQFSSDYLESSSGSDFVIGTVKNLQSGNTTTIPEAQLNLECTDEGKSALEFNEKILANWWFQLNHDIHDAVIVWTDVYTYLVATNLITGQESIINIDDSLVFENLRNFRAPATSENYITWVTTNNNSGTQKGDIWTYSLFDGELVQVTNSSEDGGNYWSPDVSGDWAAWVDVLHPNYTWGNIYACDLSTGTHTKISNDADYYYYEFEPSISGDYMVWTGLFRYNGIDYHADIRMCDLSTGLIKDITTDLHNSFMPDISDDLIVWTDNRNGDWDIYLYNLTSEKTRIICNESGNQIYPKISGNRIIWMDSRNGDYDIYMYDLIENEEVPICTNSSSQQAPVISGDYIAWLDNRTGVYQTYVKSVIDDSKLSIYGWDENNGTWMPLKTTVDNSSNNVSAEITDLGTYAVGYDLKKPAIEWDYSELYIGNITTVALITDTGSGVDNSSIKMYLDDQEQDFVYNMYTGLLYANINASFGNHTIQIYAEDTSGNIVFTPKKLIRNIKPTTITALTITDMGNDSIALSWLGESGEYPVDHYEVYQNGIFIENTTQTNFVTDACYDSAYSVCPVDTEGYNGNEDTIELKSSIFVPQFTYDWEHTLNPEIENPITFNASKSTLINGTFEDPVTYKWIIDDDLNNTKSGIIMDHVFASTGIHKITLKMEDGQTSEMTTQLIHVTAYLIASFNSSTTMGTSPLSVQFNDTSYFAKNNTSQYVESWYWDFGDGSTSTEQNPSHTYTEPGLYTVQLSISNSRGYDVETKMNYIAVYNENEQVINGGFESGLAGWSVYYDDSDAGASVENIIYQQGSKSIKLYSSSEFCRSVSVRQTVNLTGVDTLTYWTCTEDSYGGSDESGLAVYIDPANMVADYGNSIHNWTYRSINVSGYTGNHAVIFEAGCCCAEIISYIDNVSAISAANAPSLIINSPEQGANYTSFPSINVTTDKEVTFLYYLNGNNANTTSELETYIIEGKNKLVVYAIDSTGNTASERVTFYYNPELLKADFFANETSTYAAHDISFYDNSSQNVTSWSWNFGDGTTSNEQNPTKYYIYSGVYDVTLKVSDGYENDSVTKNGYIVVGNGSEFTADVTSGNAPLTVSFDSYGGKGLDLTDYLWDFGDGTTQWHNGTHTYTEPGIYNVTCEFWTWYLIDSTTKLNYINVI
jgi:beta propeller repeat protein